MKKALLFKVFGSALLIPVLLLVASLGFARQKEGKVSISISKEINGEKYHFQKEYSSEEEMKNDPELQKFNKDIGNTDEEDALHTYDHQMNWDFNMDMDSIPFPPFPPNPFFEFEFETDSFPTHFYFDHAMNPDSLSKYI